MKPQPSNLSRLERKCLVASSGLHLFLVLIVLFGSAFFKARKTEPPMQMLNVVPTRLIDEALAGGGGNPNLPRTNDRIKGETLNPTAAPPAPTPEPPKPSKPERKAEPKAVPPPTPEPVKPQAKAVEPPPKISKQALKEATKSKVEEPPKPRIDLSELKPVGRDESAKERERERQKAREEAEARAAAAARVAARDRARKAAEFSDQLQRELSSSLSGLRRGFNDGTKVDVGGPGGAAFANYKLFVQMAYDNAWVVTPELTDADLVALIKVTISRSGRVLASRIIRPSGSALMDRTVQKAMDRVRADGLPAFPPESPDAERTFTIEFNLKSKSRTG